MCVASPYIARLPITPMISSTVTVNRFSLSNFFLITSEQKGEVFNDDILDSFLLNNIQRYAFGSSAALPK
jgi:hypothetical protein